MYTVLTTCPDYGSRNVGDKLIEQRVKAIVASEKGQTEFLTIFREEPLDDRLGEINRSRAVLMPAFPIRDTPMYPRTYRLVRDLDRLRVPMIPIGANWNVYPGDAQSARDTEYSPETVSFLRRVAGQVDRISCREYGVMAVLRKHGITNLLMTGDPACFDLPSLGRPITRPSAVRRVVFSPPLSPFYAQQAEQVMTMLAELFPSAERFCAMHLADSDSATDDRAENSAAMSPEVARKNWRIRECAANLGFIVWELARNVAGMSVYDSCDLHVGYECHAHLYFLSKRIPSVLIAEDARGYGFNYTLGIGGPNGFARAGAGMRVERKTHTSGYCTTAQELALAPPRADVHLDVRRFLQEELDSGFRRYLGLGPYLDEVYERVMAPFIRSLP